MTDIKINKCVRDIDPLSFQPLLVVDCAITLPISVCSIDDDPKKREAIERNIGKEFFKQLALYKQK